MNYMYKPRHALQTTLIVSMANSIFCKFWLILALIVLMFTEHDSTVSVY